MHLALALGMVIVAEGKASRVKHLALALGMVIVGEGKASRVKAHVGRRYAEARGCGADGWL